MATVGWAFVYYPHYPEGISYSADINHGQYPDFLEAMYLSLLTFSTLGYGDVVPTDDWIRLAAPVQAVMGFAVFTAATSWFMQAYPAREHRRGAAIRLTLLRKAGYIDRVRTMDPAAGSQMMERLTEGALDDLAGLLRSRFPPTGDPTEEVFRSYAHDHGRSYTPEPPRSRNVPLGVPTL